MPIVRVSMFEGRSLAKKRQMADRIAEIVAEVCEVDPAGVHVLIDEMSRDNWARGGVLHRDRGPRPSDPTTDSIEKTTFRSIALVTVKPEFVDEYLAYRRDDVNPAMSTIPGFHGSLLGRDLADPTRFIVINTWTDEPAWRTYQSTAAHDRLRDRIRGELTSSMSIERYLTVALPWSAGLDDSQSVQTYMTVSTHRVRTSEPLTYLKLRATSVHPSMAEFQGFVSSNAMESLDEPYAYLIVNTWASKEAAAGYSESADHFSLRDQVRELLSEHSGTRQYQVVAL